MSANTINNHLQRIVTRLTLVGIGGYFAYSWLEPFIPLILTLTAGLVAGALLKTFFTARTNRTLNRAYRYSRSDAPRQNTKPKREAPREPPPPPPPDTLAVYRNLMGLRPLFTPEELKSAYREAAARFHPDRYAAASPRDRENAEILMKQVNEAYERLKAAGR